MTISAIIAGWTKDFTYARECTPFGGHVGNGEPIIYCECGESFSASGEFDSMVKNFIIVE